MFSQQTDSIVPNHGRFLTCRVKQSRLFINVDIDYAGPIIALHPELVNGLTAQAFIRALKRFMARRGKCTAIYSDNATNFVKANKHLKAIKHLHAKTKCSNPVTDFPADIQGHARRVAY